MRRTFVFCVLSLLTLGQAVLAADWHYEGTSGFSLQVYKGGPGNGDEGVWNAVTDHQYPGLWSVAADPQGNVYFTAGDIRNLNDGSDPAFPGGSNGFTIMKPDGSGGWTQLNIDLSKNGLGLLGGVTKMVVGGDGKVYALQNWMPPPYNWHWRPFWLMPGNNWVTGDCTDCARLVCRILRVNANGTVDVIREYSPADQMFIGAENPKWRNHVKGLDVGPDGNVYWWLGGTRWEAGSPTVYWDKHILWRYNVTTQMIEESPTAGTNNGWNEISQLNNFAYVGTSASGEMWFAKVRGPANSNKTWHLNPIGWSTNRTEAVNQADPSTYGHQYQFHTIYDPVINQLWVGGWSPNEGTDGKATTNIMTKWIGVPGTPSLFADELTPDGVYRYGIERVQPFHANGNVPLSTGITSGGPYWIGTMALNPKDRAVWVSWGASDTIRHGKYNYSGEFGPAGNVYTIDPAATAPGSNQGNPQTAHPDPNKADNTSRTIALTFTDSKVYATTVDLETREFNLFSADIPIPPTGACCLTGPTCQDTTEAVCDAYHGVWQGDGTACATSDCRYKVCSVPWADADADGDVDSGDFGILQTCISSGMTLGEYPPYRCECFDSDSNGQIDGADLSAFAGCAAGPGVAVSGCGN